VAPPLTDYGATPQDDSASAPRLGMRPLRRPVCQLTTHRPHGVLDRL